MKFYRLFLLAIVCTLAFISGWVIRGNYPVTQSAGLRLNPNSNFRINHPNSRSDQGNSNSFDSRNESLNSKGEKVVHKNLETNNLQNNNLLLKSFHGQNTRAESIKLKQTEKEKEIESKQKKYDTMNRKNLLNIPNNKKFLLKGKYSFLVNVFSKETKALKYVETLKKKYPLWNFFLKIYKGGVKIYLGPFETKQKANNFIDTIPKKQSPFPNYFLEKQSL